MSPLWLEPFPRDPAREEAKRELSKEIYRQQESVLSEFWRWLRRLLSNTVSGVDAPGPGGGRIGLLILGVFVVVLIAIVLIKFGPMARTRKSRAAEEAAQIAPTVSRSEHRRRADAYAAEGKFAEAVRERLRAIIADLTERDVLDDRLGRTANEIARAAGAKLPSAGPVLVEAAELFGAIWYGNRAATAASDARMREIDRTVAAAKPGQGEPLPVGAGSWVMPGADEDRGTR